MKSDVTELTLAERRKLLQMARARDLVRGDSELAPIQPVPRTERLPLSFAQQGLWFVEQLGDLGSTYHIPVRMRLRGGVDRAALVRALDGIVARHEALRTTFAEVDGVPEQRIAPVEGSGIQLGEHDLEGAADLDAELRRVIAEEVRAPFDLRHGPLIRGRLVRLAADDHVLLVTLHHMVSDAWSKGVFTRELSAGYAAAREGRQAELPPLPVQYADYAAWQRRRVEGEGIAKQADFWKRTLAGVPQLLELPTDRPRPAHVDHTGERLWVGLDEELTAGLKALSLRHGTTLFMTLLAGWATVLGRLSGQDDVVIGTPMAGRERRETEGLIGFFVNTLAVRTDLSGAPTVAELLARVRTRALEAQHQQDIPFEQVVELIRPTRSLAHSPLFQVTFAWQNVPEGDGSSLQGLAVGGMRSGTFETQAKFDLSLALRETGGRITGDLTYATSLFDRATVERWGGYLRRVLEQMVADDGQRVERLSMLSAEERTQVLEEWNRTDADYPQSSCIHELFQARAAEAPDAPAVVCEGESLTYAELNTRANRLAHHLRALGVGPDVRVAICVERSPEMLVGLLGILKAGGAYVPLDPAYPAERLAYLLADSAPAAVLTQAALRDRVAGLDVPVIELDAAAPAWADQPATNPEPGALTPAHVAYVIYTSGSTGRPKGVMVAHASLVNLVQWHRAAFGVGRGTRSSSVASLGFDAAAWEIWPPLAAGGELALPGRGRVDPDDILDWWDGQTLDVSFLPTPMAEYAFSRGVREGTVRTLLVGGDRLRRMPAEPIPFRLVNNYGPTETTVVATSGDVRGSAAPDIGRPIANARTYLLDGAGELVPLGVAGELYVGGPQVARGYLGRPGLTAERFVPDAFGAEPGARLYRTGDLCRWTPDGTLDFVGRTDHQVKVRGFRIEPGEIEARLAEHPDVREAVVLVREDAPGQARLVAYAIGGAGAEELRAHLAATLPAHMVPAAFVRVDAWPLTPNGKLDRGALPAPGGDAFAARAYEEPAGETEEALAEIWAEVLGVERVGRRDDFFGLGGHSLLAVQVISRVRQALGAEAALRELFTHPVLADFARELDGAARAALPPIEPAPRDGPVPLSFAQQRLWFLEQMGNLGSAYHIHRPVRLRGELDRAALVAALDGIVARHESLRTTFVRGDGVPGQRIAPADGSRFALVEHNFAGRDDAEAELARLLAEEVRAPFGLEQGPLIRGRLVRLAADEHVLLVTMHHIVSDGWSMGVLFGELAALYAAHHAGRAPELAPLAVQYADYAVWQRRWVEGDVLREQGDYWTRTLAGAPDVLELPADRPRPAQVDHAGAMAGLELDAEVTAGLKALSRRHGTTLFITLMAGWAVVLSRLAGRDDVVVGTPAANRGRREIEGLIGFFVNTLAVRMDLSGAPTVAELLGRVKERALGAQHHQDIPFEQVVERAAPVRSMAHHPLFQVMFTWQAAAQRSGLVLPGLEVRGAGAGSAQVRAKFDLSLATWEQDGRILGALTYATALFDQTTAERFADCLRQVLTAMAADEHRSVSRLPMLPPHERARVLEEWNRTGAEYPDAACVHELFQQQAARTPDAVAVEYGDGALAYGELNARANRLACHLRALGVGPDARVALCVERGPELVPAMLAVLKAGGAYVPLDPSYPEDRLRYMLADSRPSVLLASPAQAQRLAGSGVPVIDPADTEAWAHHPAADPRPAGLSPDHLCYVIYTSGSTGRPKGVAVPHRGVLSLLADVQRRAPLGEGDACSVWTSTSFDVSVYEIFSALLAGARLCIPGDELRLQAGAFLDWMEDRGVSGAYLPPHLVPALHDRVAAAPERTRLRRLLVGVEPIAEPLLAGIRAAVPGLRILNGYGPTETTICATLYDVPLQARGDGPAPIGAPSANTRVFVLDAAGEPVPVGVAGELYAGGVQVARGYLDRPALTAERFVPDAFGAEPGARLYRTGDLCRWTAEGTLEFAGRADHQVKVRGFRIEPGEIESRLLEHPDVRAAVVVAREDAPGDTRLVAYVAAEAPVAADALRAHLAERLPAYMVPAAFVRLDEFPRTPNGKVDRGALPAPEGDAFAARAYEEPAEGTEEALAEIWAEVLGVERVGRWDDFFALGGHSLLAVQVISRVRQVLEVEVALGELFTRPVLADFARELETAARADLPPIEPADRGARLPLSFAQQRLWFLEQLGSLGTAYHIHRPLRLRGVLDREALVRALDGIVARHESLRTTFTEVDGIPGQRIAPAGTGGFPLLEYDLAGHPGAEAEFRRLMAENARAPFDLANGPLIRGRLIRLAEDDSVLLLTMHHIVSDGWSMGVLTTELSALYAAHRDGAEPHLPALPVQYADYAAWQRRWVGGEVLGEQTAYWTGMLAGAPERLELPADHPRPARMDHTGAQLGVELDAELTAGLKALSRRHGTTLFMTLLAGWAVVLGRLSGQSDVVIGTPTAGRGRREIEGLIGFFVNTLAVRVDLSDAPTVEELLGRVKKRALGAQHHQDIPFEQVVELLDPVRSLAHHPLFQVMFTWQNVPRGNLDLPGLNVGGVAGAGAGAADVQAKFDLSLSLREVKGRIVGSITYATALFERETVDRWAGYLRQVLQEMAADDRLGVDRVSLLPAEERARVVEEWNATDAPYPRELCTHQLFERQVERTPDAIAVNGEDGTLTYAELNARANRLAHHLIGLGVGPDILVGLCMERGLEMAVGVLAVLKAGGAYVPLDPDYPADRLRFMVEDSHPAALLASRVPESLVDGLTEGSGVPVIRIETDGQAWADRPESNPARTDVHPEHLVYCIYTSGSTGRPKGVMNHHGCLVNRLSWGARVWTMSADDVVMCKTSLSFDGHIREMFLPWSVGARVAMARPGGQRDPDYLVDLIRAEGVTTMNMNASMLLVLLEHPLIEQCTSLRQLLVGGEALPGTGLTRLLERLPATALHITYGPSEAATAMTAMHCGPEQARATVPIGRPTANSRVYLLDAAGGPVPVGVTGELFIGGDSVCRGYLDRPGLTAERFVPDPFGAEPGERLYRTGDLGRWLPDGMMEFLGRNDFQVKVRGFRVEPGEIEARLREHPGVRETVVIVREDVPGDRRLVAYWVGDDALEVDALRAHLAGRLPDYMIPAAFVRLDALPMTPSVKLDRAALPSPEGGAYASREYEPPVNETEEALAEIWAEVLRIDRVGRRDNFFDLGGHSLLAVQVVSRVRQALGVNLPLGELFTRPVLQDLAQEVMDAQLAQFDPAELAELAALLGES
ncbi:non-ribosomal peptide synthetase [Longimicrobium terrae]|uniref:Amino acid adenylation domain-containing protein n=1 Tax=Longimicrobium terrae TaxID=1639882 RepID=A0A841GWI7_9BACT|nr:non-ribosomal peptide synthetase [Longimicrobium terrae]MBB4636053.1 amino acid adenylation domain-containing protein [Longimicrobium terrae]MBB6070448.1 amino acid adenylation domain-containing protein [Longimicrobium terrae]NNC33227.1 amino acid adenylation domain-containing protein [Longimicrobium terrae]